MNNNIYSQKPLSFNIELTEWCPLKCPQCYCQFGKRYIDKELAINYIGEAGDLGIQFVNLSGGETLAYPYLFEILRKCRQSGMLASIAISGWNFSKEVLRKLIISGVGRIYISLNGSTEKINSLSRDGFCYSIDALKILSENDFPDYYVNWVATKYNIDDFPKLVEICRKYDVKKIIVIAYKPSNTNQISFVPELKHMLKLKNYIIDLNKKYKDYIIVEQCYYSLKHLITQNDYFGCLAGRTNFSISVDGSFTPCRHIKSKEKFETIEMYWNNSKVLNQIRNQIESKNYLSDDCKKCYYSLSCVPCLISDYINSNSAGNNMCKLYNFREEDFT